MTTRATLLAIYRKLYKRFGPRHWWPAETPFEVIVGAILTQNTAWSNVEKAILNLKRKKVLSVKKMETVSLPTLRTLIRPSGFYREKALKLKAIVRYLISASGGDIGALRKRSSKIVRKELLGVRGIGRETADSILLYALNKPIFVVDAYTKRVFSRHTMVSHSAPYEDIQKIFMDNLPQRVKLFNEYHALIVQVGKEYCKKKHPRCSACPLRGYP